MGTVLKIKLNSDSIQKAIKEVETYKGSLETRTRVFVGRLIEMGLDVARARIAESPLGRCVTIDVSYQNPKYGCKGILYATGQELYSEMDEGHVNALLLIEFGAGVAVNPVTNPLSDKFGLGPGTYGKGHGNDPTGWWYLDMNNKWIHTKGTKATMPMFMAYDKIMQNIQKTAEEVFSTNKVVEC
jgi:hypothetical protein